MIMLATKRRPRELTISKQTFFMDHLKQIIELLLDFFF